MSRELEELFPNLADSGYEITGEASRVYNCTAWALGITSQRWDCDVPGSYWPPSLPRDNRIETLMRLFAREGFALCDDDSPEPGYEKIALYAFVGTSPTWPGSSRMAGGAASWETWSITHPSPEA